MNTSFSVKDCILVDIPTFTLHHIKNDKDRGAHALLDSFEILVAIHGSFVVELDDTETKTSIVLDDPSKGLMIQPGIWFRTHSYKEDGVSLILASEKYARDKYTYDYEEYKRLRKI